MMLTRCYRALPPYVLVMGVEAGVVGDGRFRLRRDSAR